MFSILKRLIFATLAVIGGIVTLTEFFDLFSERDIREISFTTKESVVFSGTDRFSVISSFRDKTFEGENNNVYETIITLWNTGDTPLLEQEIRSPLTFYTGSNSVILDSKIIQIKSSVDNKFNLVSNTDKDFQIKWRIFDPGMAIKLSVLQSGSQRAISVRSDLGPKTAVKPYSQVTNSFTIILWSILISFLLVFSLLFLLLVKYLMPDYKVEYENRSFVHRHDGKFFVLGFTCLITSAVVIFTYITPKVLSYVERPSSPISIDASLVYKS